MQNCDLIDNIEHGRERDLSTTTTTTTLFIYYIYIYIYIYSILYICHFLFKKKYIYSYYVSVFTIKKSIRLTY
jgi:hypothetical protein